MFERGQLEALAKPVVNIYMALEIEMLRNMGSLLKGNKNILETDPEAWRLQQLEMLGILDKQNLETIRRYSGLTNSELNKVLLNAGLDGLEMDEKEIIEAQKKGAKLITPAPITQSPVILSILRAYQEQASNTLNLTNQTMIDQSKKMYIDTLNKAALDVASGYKSHQQAIAKTIDTWADTGIPALIDKAGRRWSTEGYVRTVMVTTVNNVTNEMQDARFAEWGVEFVEVSAHAGARPLCAPYQGRIYSLDGDSERYPNLYGATSIGHPAGLFGVNCKHRKYPYFPDISYKRYQPTRDKAENERIYKESQVQRKIERDIRKAKTREIVHQAAGNNLIAEEARKQIREHQALMREFIERTGRTRRRDREQIHGISKT